MKNRTEEILKEMSETVRVNPYTIDERITPTKLAHFLASLEARVEALEGPSEEEIQNDMYETYVGPRPKEPVSWEGSQHNEIRPRDKSGRYIKNPNT